MKRTLPVLAALLLGFSGCGEDAAPDPGAGDPASAGTSAGSPTTDPTGSPTDVDHSVLAVVTGNDPGDGVATEPTYIGDRLALLRYLEQFRFSGPAGVELATEIEKLVRAAPAPSGQTLVAAVVRAGCEPVAAADLTVRSSGGALRVTAPAERSGVQCVAVLASVAVIQVPRDAVDLPKDATRTPDPADD